MPHRLNFWHGMRISRKLPLLISIPTILITLISASLSFWQTRIVLRDELRTAYETLLEERHDALQYWLNKMKGQTRFESESEHVHHAVVDFTSAMSGAAAGGLHGAPAAGSGQGTGHSAPAGTASAWDMQHKKYHEGFETFMKENGYYDLFLFDASGNMVYSVLQEADFGTNFLNGPYAGSGLGIAYRGAMELPEGEVYLSELAPYEPSSNAPAMFLAAPVIVEGETVGVVALQAPNDRMTEILAKSRLLGETGLVYLISEEGVAMNASPFDGGHKIFDRLPESEQTAAAIRGEVRYFEDAPGLDGHRVVAASSSVDTGGGHKWGLVLEIDRAEAFAAELWLAETSLFQAAAVSALVALLCWLAARSITSRIGKLSASVGRIASGDYGTAVPDTDSGDEIGEIARNLETFKSGLSEAAKAAAETERQQKEQEEVVRELSTGLKTLAGGDFTRPIETAFPPGHEQLRKDFNSTAQTLNGAVTQVIGAVSSIRGGASEISQASDDLSHRTESQAATLEQTAAALDQLTASVKSSAEGARSVEATMKNARLEAEKSGQVVQSAVKAMNDIEESSTHISQIISVIDDIAFQTNLLALNAGVEAARAGEAGKGFAVVASEVRALAQRSSDAAMEIKTLIGDSSKQVENGVELVGKTGAALESIAGQVAHISELVSGIAEASAEQSTGLAEINTGVIQLDQVTQQNSAMVEEATAASHLLNADASKLSELVDQFKTTASTQPGKAMSHPPGGTMDPVRAEAEDWKDASGPARPAAESEGNAARDLWQDF